MHQLSRELIQKWRPLISSEKWGEFEYDIEHLNDQLNEYFKRRLIDGLLAMIGVQL